MSPDEISDVIYQTVLVKIKKSQDWMRCTRILPHDFTIFAWLPCETPEECGRRAERLVERQREEGWPFYLRLVVPPEPGSLFPCKFAFRHYGRVGWSGDLPRRPKTISEADLSTFERTDFESDTEDDSAFDIFALAEEEEEQEQ